MQSSQSVSVTPVANPASTSAQVTTQLPQRRTEDLSNHIMIHGTAGPYDGYNRYANPYISEAKAREQLKQAGIKDAETRSLTLALGFAVADIRTGTVRLVSTDCTKRKYVSVDGEYVVYQPLVERDETWSDDEWQVAFKTNDSQVAIDIPIMVKVAYKKVEEGKS